MGPVSGPPGGRGLLLLHVRGRPFALRLNHILPHCRPAIKPDEFGPIYPYGLILGHPTTHDITYPIFWKCSTNIVSQKNNK